MIPDFFLFLTNHPNQAKEREQNNNKKNRSVQMVPD